jgi:phosphopantothenoylcysteine decarboxylase / phosphopantothenate---cysteine ligase
VRTPDILATLGERKNGTFLVGFAAETEDVEANAREKLAHKHLDAIAVNDVSTGGVGFGTGDNEIVVLWKDGREALGRGSKRGLACRMWNVLIELHAKKART